MSQKKIFKPADCSKEKKQENLKEMVMTGEPLADTLMEILSLFGSSPEGLMVETYAMAKAWAALKAVAKSKNLDPVPLFEKLVPMFKEEMESAVNETE
jgi:hypothetical protein